MYSCGSCATCAENTSSLELAEEAREGSRPLNQFQPPPFLRGIEKSMIRKISDRAKPGSISLGLGEPDLPTPDVILREAVRVIQEEKSGYTLQAGIPALRERIAGDYPHLNLNLDQIIVTSGSQEA